MNVRHTVDLLDEAIELAGSIGIDVRRQWLGEAPGGLCRVGEAWILYVNLSQSAAEQLEEVVYGLSDFPHVPVPLAASAELTSYIRRLYQEANGDNS